MRESTSNKWLRISLVLFIILLMGACGMSPSNKEETDSTVDEDATRIESLRLEIALQLNIYLNRGTLRN